MTPETEEVCDNGGCTPNKVGDEQQPLAPTVEVADDKNKSPRHPRWTRQETLTLIEGKRVAENRGRGGRRSSSADPKWDSVASYCKQRAVNRGPVQCRKRWSNMVGDYKKIKAWESHEESESYWVMRNDVRKENKMPGFFDREVFDVLDGKAVTKEAYKLALVTVTTTADNDSKAGDQDDDLLEADVAFDSRRSDDRLFHDHQENMDDHGNYGKDHDYPTTKIVDPVPISEKRYQPFHQNYTQGNLKEQKTNSVFWKECMSQDGCKRRKVSTNECQDKNFNDRLLDVLEKNANMLKARVDAENTNCHLERGQRKDFNESVTSALNRISDALTKIADKL